MRVCNNLMIMMLCMFFYSNVLLAHTGKSTVSTPSLGSLLLEDGRIDPDQLRDGGFNPAGYRMSFGLSGEPIFTAAGSSEWDNRFFEGFNGSVEAIAVSGSEIYIGGNFSFLGGNSDINYIAKWNGVQWESVGPSLNANVTSIAISGSDVYVGGWFTDAGGDVNADYIAKWNGNVWSALGTGLNAGVYDIAIEGSNIYVGGGFTDVGSPGHVDDLFSIAKWNGNAWEALDVGLNNTVFEIAVSGPDVYAGGYFTDAGGDVNADYIAKWNGTSWSALGTVPLTSDITAIAVSGTDVYIGGDFGDIGGDPSLAYVAKWDGVQWSALGSGLNSRVVDIVADGSDIYVAGNFAHHVAKWNGSIWTNLTIPGESSVNAIAVVGSNLYAGGYFFDAGGDQDADYFAVWNGTQWNSMISGGMGLSDAVYAIAVSGNDVYVGGSFADAGGNPDADYIARWDGTQWHSLGEGFGGGNVYAIAVLGTDVYVGGGFTFAAGNPNINYIAKWDGISWSPLGSGLNGQVNTIAVSGTDILVGGFFFNAGGDANADRIARWNGSAWLSLGSGLNNTVYDIAMEGSDIYVAGTFTNAGGNVNADKIARWNGSSWEALGSGLTSNAYAIAISGTDVYVGVQSTVNGIEKWNGTSWESVGSGLNNWVRDIIVSDTDIYVAGFFTDAGGNTDADYIAKWNGISWSPLGSGTNGMVRALAISGSNLYAGGHFTMAGGNVSSRFGIFNKGNLSPIVRTNMRDTTLAEDFDRQFIYKLSDFFQDPENNELDFSAITLTPGVTADVSNDSLYVRSESNYNGNVNITVIASDGELSISDAFTVSVAAVNDAPELSLAFRDTIFSINFGRQFVYNVPIHFADADGDPLSYIATSLSTGVDAELSNDSLYVRSTSGFFGSAILRIVCSDGIESIADSFVVWVSSPPILTMPLRDSVLSEDFSRKFLYELTDYFTDPENNPLTFSVMALSEGAIPEVFNDSLYLNSVQNFFGSVSIVVTALKGPLTLSDTLDVVVTPVNDPPFLAMSLRDTVFYSHYPKTFLMLLTEVFGDVDHSVLSYSAENLTFGIVTQLSNDSLYIFSSSGPASRIDFIRITASDGSATVSAEASVTVVDTTRPSIFSGALASDIINKIRLAVGGNEHLENVTAEVNGTAMAMTRSGSLFFGDHTLGNSNSVVFLINATDRSGNASSLTRQYTVSRLNRPAVFGNYRFRSASDGYVLLSRKDIQNKPIGWEVIGEAVEWLTTAQDSPEMTIEVSYDAQRWTEGHNDFDEAKIGLYRLSSQQHWEYIGGQGNRGKVMATYRPTLSKSLTDIMADNLFAVFYNPDHTVAPKEFELKQNYPNPFNPVTTIRYELPAEVKVVLKIYNVLGQEVRTLVNESQQAGVQFAKWDGKNNHGEAAASGIYFYKLQAGNFVRTQKMLLIK